LLAASIWHRLTQGDGTGMVRFESRGMENDSNTKIVKKCNRGPLCSETGAGAGQRGQIDPAAGLRRRWRAADARLT
jgi:hypothetical protein